MKNLRRHLNKTGRVFEMSREEMNNEGQYDGIRAGVLVYQKDDAECSEPDIMVRWYRDGAVSILDYYAHETHHFDKHEQDEACALADRIMAHNRAHVH